MKIEVTNDKLAFEVFLYCMDVEKAKIVKQEVDEIEGFDNIYRQKDVVRLRVDRTTMPGRLDILETYLQSVVASAIETIMNLDNMHNEYIKRASVFIHLDAINVKAK